MVILDDTELGINHTAKTSTCLSILLVLLLLSSSLFVGVFGSSGIFNYPDNTAITTDNQITSPPTGAISNITLGSVPMGIAYDSVDNTIYVGNEDSNNVSVINASTNKVITSIDIGTRSIGVAYDSANNTIYSVSYYSNNVSVINASTNKVITSINVGKFPQGITYDDATNMIYVTNHDSSNISVINASTNKVIESIGVMGLRPVRMAYNQASNIIYVSTDDGIILFINASTNSVITTIYLPSGVYGDWFQGGLAYDSLNSFLYCTDGGRSSVFVINTSSVAMGITTLDMRGFGILCDNTDNTIYVTTCYISGDVSVINASTGAVITTIHVGGSPYDLAYDTVNNALYVTDTPAGVSVISMSVENAITFTETGLPSGTIWYVNITGQQSFHAPAGLPIIMYLPNGTYTYSVESQNKNFHNDTSGGVQTFTAKSTSTRINSIFLHWAVHTSSIEVGSSPSSAAYDSLNNTIYVIHHNTNSISVINASSNKVTANISVGSSPDGIVYDSANNTIYVTNSNNVSVINASTNRITTSIGVGTSFCPSSVAYDSLNNTIYVIHPISNSVSVINASANQVITSIIVGSNPQGITYDSSNNTIYVANCLSSNVSVINASSNKITTNVYTGTDPLDAIYDSSNNTIYVINWASGNVSVINAATNRITHSISVGEYPTSAAYDSLNNTIYVVHPNSNIISLINASSNKITMNISVGSDPQGITYDSSNNTIYVANLGSNNISVISPLQAAVLKEFPVTLIETGLPAGIVWSVKVSGESTISEKAGAPITIDLTNNSYTYPISTMDKIYHADSSTFSVNGTPVRSNIFFMPNKYKLTIMETGLPNGTTWILLFNGRTYNITGSTFTAYVENGTFTYSASMNGYTAEVFIYGYKISNGTGSVYVSGIAYPMTIQFQKKTYIAYYAAGALAAFFAAILYLNRYVKRKYPKRKRLYRDK